LAARRASASPADVPHDKTANEWGRAKRHRSDHGRSRTSFYNNAVAADLGVSSTYRVADLNNEAAKNLMPWAVDALKQQNALALAKQE